MASNCSNSQSMAYKNKNNYQNTQKIINYQFLLSCNFITKLPSLPIIISIFKRLKMDCELTCPRCCQQYSQSNLPRILTSCGHTYCQNCLNNLIQNREGGFHVCCPDDGLLTHVKNRSVLQIPRNLALLRVMENKKEGALRELDMNVSKITKNSLSNESNDTCDIIKCIQETREESQNILEWSYDKKQQPNIEQEQKQLQAKCPVHNKPLDVVCTVDLMKICSSCAIFGEHRGHSFKSLEEVGQIQTEYCGKIQAIINQKQKIQKQILCSETINDILSILVSKKNKMKNQIIKQFATLQFKINAKKQQVLRSLEEITRKQQANLKSCVKISSELQKDYDQWYQKSSSQLRIISEDDFEAKLLLLFEGVNIDGDIIGEGKYILAQIKTEQEKMLIEVEKKLQNLNVLISGEIYRHIEGFVQVINESIKTQPAKNELLQRSSLRNKRPQITSSLSLANLGHTPTSLLASSIPSGVYKQSSIQRRQANLLQPQKTVSILSSAQSNLNLDESLLQSQDVVTQPQITMFSLKADRNTPDVASKSLGVEPALSQRVSMQRKSNIVDKGQRKPASRMSLVKSPGKDQGDRFNKKKLSRLRLPQKYEKVVESLISDSLQIADFTNGELGDACLAHICQLLPNSKVRTLKLIRNKLTDQGLAKILPCMSQITTLNLSQNLLTDNVLDIIYQNRTSLGNLRTLILSQNRIAQRKQKLKIDRMKKLQWTVSL